MPKKEAFVIPQGLQFEQTTKGVIIENQGDIVLKGSLGLDVYRLVSTDGNIHIEQPLTVGELIALNGSVSCDTSLDVDTIQAKELEVGTDLQVHTRIHTSKKMLVHGNLKTGKIQSLGNLEVHGSVECDEISVEGDAHIAENLLSESLSVDGKLRIDGDVICQDFKHTGSEAHFGSLETNTLHAPNASVHVDNSLVVNHVQCLNLSSNGDLKTSTIQVTENIQLTDNSIHADVIMCDTFSTVGNVVGKVLVLEAPIQNGTHRIKGCLELSDFADLVPNIDAFLASKGLHRQDDNRLEHRPTKLTSTEEDSSESTEESSEETPTSEATPALHVNLNTVNTPNEPSISEETKLDYHDEHENLNTERETLEPEATPARIAMPLIARTTEVVTTESDERNTVGEQHTDNEQIATEEMDALTPEHIEIDISERTTQVELTSDTTGDDLTLANSDVPNPEDTDINLDTPLDTDTAMSEEWTYDDAESKTDTVQPSVPEPNPLYEAIRNDIIGVIENYDDANYPEAIRELLHYLDTEDFLTLRDELRHLWSGLLKYHQHQNSRIPPDATKAFTSLNKNMAKLKS